MMDDRDERTLYARQQDRIAALEAELAERTRERDELRYEKRARSAIDPNERLHNLCDGLAASRRESPYDQEAWDLADASNRELQAELAERTRDLDYANERAASHLDDAYKLRNELTAERERREAAKRDAELLWANCRVIYFPDPSGSYPLEHNMRACGTKDSRADIEAALRIDAARKEGT